MVNVLTRPASADVFHLPDPPIAAQSITLDALFHKQGRIERDLEGTLFVRGGIERCKNAAGSRFQHSSDSK